MVDKQYAVRPSNAIKRARRTMLTLMSGNRHTLNANQVRKITFFSSSEVGRAGTCIAACYLMQHLLSNATTIDVFGTVVALRKWRPGLVQVPVSLG